MTAEAAGPGLTAELVAERLSSAVGGAFRAFTAQVQTEREDLYALTMSGIGGCTRQAAYRLARTAPSETATWTEMREANLGTMMHLGLLPHLAPLVEGTEEIGVTLKAHGLTINGRSDLYTEALRTVADLKTVGTYKFTALGATVNRSHRLQVAGYAQAVAQSGRDVDWIAWMYLCRSSGADHVMVEQFDQPVLDALDHRLVELATFAEEPEAAPRDERGPGLSVVCDGCPWLRRCWGEDARPGEIGAQRILIRDNDGVEQALRLYDDARVRESEARADKDFAKAMFSASQEGQYGEFELGWSGAGRTDDKDAAVRMLREAGIPVPQKTTSRRLIVKRAR